MNRWELEQKIVVRALKDPAFRKKLLLQPNEAVREFLKQEKVMETRFLDNLNIRVIEEKKEEWILAIPSVSLAIGELTEQQMQWLAAGCNLNTNVLI